MHIKQGPVRAQLDALISQLESAFSDRPVSAEHVSQALESLLFPFMTHINPQGQNSDPCTLIVEEYRTTTPSFSIKLQSTAAVIGEVATKSRVPFDFYLSPQMSLNIEAYSDTPGIEKGISIHFGSEDFRLLRLTPKKSMAICNSFPWAARLFNAVEESVTGLNLVMPVQVNGLDFTEQGHVAMRDEDLAPTGWSTADVEHSKSEALTFLQTVAPKEALANRFAKSAWTMGCIRQKPDEYCGAGFPKARSVNFLNVIRDTSVHVNDDPGRMTWRGMGDISLAQHMLSVDQHWSPHGKKGDVILSVHKGKATVLCK